MVRTGGLVSHYSELLPFFPNLTLNRNTLQDKVEDNEASEVQIPTRSLCLSSVLVVILQPGCQTVDPEEGMHSVS